MTTLLGDEPVKSGFTTPEAPELQALLAVMRERGLRAVAMEVSSHALAMRRADGIEFAVAAFTNLSQDHLDFHADMEDYFAAKARLFDGRARAAVIVVRRRMGAAAGRDGGSPCRHRVERRSRGDLAGERSRRRTRTGRTAFRVLGPGVDLPAGCAVPGSYNVANALLALAILAEAGVDLRLAAPAVAQAVVPGRMERVDAGQPFLAVVDYATSRPPSRARSAHCARSPPAG